MYVYVFFIFVPSVSDSCNRCEIEYNTWRKVNMQVKFLSSAIKKMLQLIVTVIEILSCNHFRNGLLTCFAMYRKRKLTSPSLAIEALVALEEFFPAPKMFYRRTFGNSNFECSVRIIVRNRASSDQISEPSVIRILPNNV